MYAIVKTGGKQYRVEQGQSLLVERLSASEGDKISLDPLLYVDGSNVVDQVDGLSGVTIEARVLGHERGPKLRVVKFKPKRGYKRRNGHRQELTRIEVVSLKLTGGRKRGGKAAASEETEASAGASTPTPVAAEEKPKPSRSRSTSSEPKQPATEATEAAEKKATEASGAEAADDSGTEAADDSGAEAAEPSGAEAADDSEGTAAPKTSRSTRQRSSRAKPKEEGDGS